MDFSGMQNAIKASGGIPNASVMSQIDEARKAGTLRAPPLSQLREVWSSRPKPVFPKVKVEPFKYLPLPTPTSIRLLKIGMEDDEGLLRCDLITVDLETRPLYNCLSYTWGNSQPEGFVFVPSAEEEDQKVVVNGHEFKVRKNLYDALMQLPRQHFAHLRDEHRKQTIHRFSEAGNALMVWMSIMQGSNVNSKDKSGKTALHYAAKSGDLESTEVLVSAGADLDVLDIDHKSPTEVAQDHGNDVVFQYLTKIGKLKDKPEVIIQAQNDPAVCCIWVDAMCIDQKNIDERGHQVRLMRKIYEQSSCVLIWLGKSDELTARAIETVSKIAAHDRQLMNSDIIPYGNNDHSLFEKAGMPEISGQEWDALASLYLRKWFSRAWTIQETVLAREILMFCGKHEIIFDDLCVATEALCHRYEVMGFPSSAYWGIKFHQDTDRYRLNAGRYQVQNLRAGSSGIESLFNAVVKMKTSWILKDLPPEVRSRHGAWGEGESLALSALVLRASHFECQDPRDKVYALLGLAVTDAGAHKIDPDYNKTADELYVQLTRYILRKQEGLYILSNIVDSERTDRLPNLPSWVPDFSTTGFTAQYGTKFRAAGTQKHSSQVDPAPENRKLEVRSMELGTVLQIGDCFDHEPHANPHVRLDPTWYKVLDNLDPKYSTGEDRADVLWKTLCLNQDAQEDSSVPDQFREQFREYICALICAEGVKEKAEKDSARERAYAIMQPMFEMQGMPPEEAKKYVAFTRAVNEAKGTPDPSVSGPYFDPIRATLVTIDKIAKSQPNSALPTLEMIENFRQNSKWHLTDGGADNPFRVSIPQSLRFAHVAGPRYHRKRLLRTSTGYLGLGPRSMREGDQVHVVAGASLPFVLRPLNEGNYKLLGSCYVHGIMYGEVLSSESVFADRILE